PMVNHWWNVPFYVSARGLETSPMPAGGGRVFDVALDLVEHRLGIRTRDGAIGKIRLCDGPLAAFYRDYTGKLARLGIAVQLYPVAVEVPERVRLDQDDRPCGYDPDWAGRFFQALVRIDQLLREFRGRFLGKASPVHFFWGGFDLAAT